MRASSLLLAIAAGIVAVGVAASPASAASDTRRADADAQTVAAADAGAPVTGEPWSSPAYPVDCVFLDGQVSCTPENAADVKPQQCFLNVLLDGAKATVCTTYEDHIAALKTSGGKPTVVEYGCSLGDVVCVTFENAGRGMAIASTAMMFAVAQNMRFDTSSLLWTASTREWSFWQWAVLAVLFSAMVWAVAAAIVSGDRAELIGAIVRSFITIPATAMTLWLTGHLLNTMDDLTWYIMNRDGPAGLFSTLQSVMWAGGRANYFFAFVIDALLMLGMLLLMLVFAFRNIVLAALITVGPIAWMLYPVRAVGPQWVVRYVSAVAVLLLTGPLTIGFVTLIINGLASTHTIWDPQSWPLLIGLVLVAFAPFAVFGLFSFVGAVAADSIGSRVGSGAGRAATNAARSVSRIPSRIAAHPAGTPSARGSRSGSASGGSPSRGSASTTGSSARSGARPAGSTTATPSSTSPSHTSSSTSTATAPRPSTTAQPQGAPPAPRTGRTSS